MCYSTLLALSTVNQQSCMCHGTKLSGDGHRSHDIAADSSNKEALEKRVPIYVDVADPMRFLEMNMPGKLSNMYIHKYILYNTLNTVHEFPFKPLDKTGQLQTRSCQ